MTKEQMEKLTRLWAFIVMVGTLTYVWFFALASIYEKWLRPALGW